MASDQHSLFNDRIITQTALHYQAQPNVIPLPENSNENPMLGLLLLSEAAMQRAVLLRGNLLAFLTVFTFLVGFSFLTIFFAFTLLVPEES
jgi:hypothetical protein